MKSPFADHRMFWKEFRQTFRTTGAVLPSGRALARALASNVRKETGAKRILEVGPGTGAVTVRIIEAMGPNDTLDMVELNERFVQRLEERFSQESHFSQVASRSKVLHQSIETLSIEEPYDLVVSGLPLNNFGVQEVENILESLVKLLKPAGTLSFFEYIAVRRTKAVISGAADRERLRGIGRALDRLFLENQAQRQWVWPNVPPAWVHHVTKGSRA